jgi:hypothetical protein
LVYGEFRLGILGGWRRLAVAAELVPRSCRWTVLYLRPGRRVHATRRYFRAGHGALDQITDELVCAAVGSDDDAARVLVPGTE